MIDILLEGYVKSYNLLYCIYCVFTAQLIIEAFLEFTLYYIYIYIYI